MHFKGISLGQRSAYLRGEGRLWVAVATRRSVPPQRQLQTQALFGFGKKSLRTDSQSAGMVGGQSRDDYGYDDVEQYFNYMGMLAVDGTYDRMQSYLDTGLHPIDILLLWAAAEGDDPKVEELLQAGASPEAEDMNGKRPTDLAGNDRVRKLLSAAL